MRGGSVSIRITIQGADKLKNLPPRLAEVLRAGTFLGVQKIRTEMISSMQESKSGRAYLVRNGPKGPYITPMVHAHKRSRSGVSALKTKGRTGRSVKGGRIHIASAPGQAPAVLFGTLIRSIKSVQAKRESTATAQTATIAIHSPYAATLEYRMNRPFVRPAIHKSTPAIKQIFIDLIRKKFGGKS